MKKIIKEIYSSVFPGFVGQMKKYTTECKSILDVGCGTNSVVQYLSNSLHKVGIDGHLPSIEISRKKRIHNEYYQLNICEMEKAFQENQYDCVIACDVIEHLDKEDGFRLLRTMERIAKKLTIIKTPNGFIQQGEYDDNPLQVHKSGWEVDEMKDLGYVVYGASGWKVLRGEMGEYKYRPKTLCRFVSDLTQIFTQVYPKIAFEMCCLKKKEKCTLQVK